MAELSDENDSLAEAVADLRLWLDGERSMTNYIVGSLGGHEGDSEIERRLIWEADNAQIVARAALVNAEAARLYRPGQGDPTDLRTPPFERVSHIDFEEGSDA